LLKDAQARIADCRSKNPRDSLCVANCLVASDLVESDYGKEDASPFVIAAYLLTRWNGRTAVVVYAVNCRRETDQVMLVCRTPEGSRLWVRMAIRRSTKDASLVSTLVWPAKMVEVAQLAKMGKSAGRGEVFVWAEMAPFTAQPTPNAPDLVVAIRDRNGMMSNFVPVRRLKE